MLQSESLKTTLESLKTNLESSDLHWSAEIVDKIQTGTRCDLFSECRRWVDWVRQDKLKQRDDALGVWAIMRQIVSRCPGVLLEGDVVRPLLPLSEYDSMVEWWIEMGGRVDADSFLRFACSTLRFSKIYSRVLGHATNVDEIFLLAVRLGNTLMLEEVCKKYPGLSDETKRLALSMLYTLECDDCNGTFCVMERFKLLSNVAVDETMKLRFWARSDDEVKAAWLVKLEGAGITCMRPSAKVLLQPRVLELVRRALVQ